MYEKFSWAGLWQIRFFISLTTSCIFTHFVEHDSEREGGKWGEFWSIEQRSETRQLEDSDSPIRLAGFTKDNRVMASAKGQGRLCCIGKYGGVEKYFTGNWMGLYIRACVWHASCVKWWCQSSPSEVIRKHFFFDSYHLPLIKLVLCPSTSPPPNLPSPNQTSPARPRKSIDP